jgi:hypothetical protein
MTDLSDRPSSFSIPRGAATRGLLELVNGSSNLRLHAALPPGYRDADVLAAGTFGGRVPDVRVEADGHLRIAYRRSFRDLTFDWRGIDADVALAPGLPWDVLVRGGVSGLDADLRGVRLGALEIAGGASDARLHLDRPGGHVRVLVLGGLDQLRLVRPADVPVRVIVHGGASALAVDTLRLGSVGGPFEYQTPGFTDASDRYVIEIQGGVSSLEVSPDAPRRAVSSSPVEASREGEGRAFRPSVA